MVFLGGKKLCLAILEGGELVLMKNSPTGNRFGTLKVQTVLHFFDDIGLNTSLKLSKKC